jgi:tetratricopeptide (TPR) repeat protein
MALQPLDPDVAAKIEELCDEAEVLFEAEDDGGAVDKYQAALDLIPGKDKLRYAESIPPLIGMGELLFVNEQYEEALEMFRRAKNCPGGSDNGFIMLRYGQCGFEVQEPETAKAGLLKAFELDGEEAFEDEDPKYWLFVDFLENPSKYENVE